MHEEILKSLNNIEIENGIKVLFACESGSRAWGFPSPDSDFDVRFVYTHDLAWYLKIEKTSDTIDQMLPKNIDIGGWELKKALTLFAGCNLPFNEWLGSPIIYFEANSLRETIKTLIPEFFNGRKALHHYFSLGSKTAEKHLSGSEIGIKKLFYILRPVYACLWIFKNHSMPPTEFPQMLCKGLVDESTEATIRDILRKKEKAHEGEVIELSSGFIAWLKKTLTDTEERTLSYPTKSCSGSTEKLNETIFEQITKPTGFI